MNTMNLALTGAKRRRAPDWDPWEKQLLKTLWAQHGGKIDKIAKAMGRTRGSISGQSMRMHLQFHSDIAPRPVKAGSRFDVLAQSRFHKGKVQDPNRLGVLKPGRNQRKLGDRVLKGAWKGMPIYSLTLEERATCPRTCAQWLSCYGNHMGMAVRYRPGDALEAQIFRDLDALETQHPGGFVVRLHILGDFYSVEYVKFWAAAINFFPGLRVFGYSARQPSDEIGQLIARLRDKHWDRFAIRTSGGASGPCTSVITSVHPPPPGIVCPAQTGATSHCGNCALCWAPAAKNIPILFQAH